MTDEQDINRVRSVSIQHSGKPKFFWHPFKIKTGWKLTGKVQFKAGWFGVKVYVEESRKLGLLQANEEHWQTEQWRWRRMKNREATFYNNYTSLF